MLILNNYMLKEFLDFNTHCPSCQEPLTLFMRWSGEILDNDYRLFKFYRKENKNLAFREIVQNKKTSEITGIIYPETNSISFNTSSAEKIIQDQDSIYFFFLCNPNSIQDLSYDYEIDAYKACYFRSSFPINFVKENNLLHPSYLEPQSHVLRDESFILVDRKEELEKVYILTLSYEDNKTILMHYSVTDEQAKDDSYEPSVFTKEVPLLKTRPDPSDKEKLLDRLNSWIIMS